MNSPTLTPQKPGLWRRTPPAIFPPILGAFGLAIAWRRASEVFGAPSGIGEFLIGAVSLLYLFALVAYVSKVLRRPGVVVDDLKVLPGRAGLAAMSMAGMLLALALVPYAPAVAGVVLAVAVVAHLLFLAIIIRALLTGPPEARQITPVFHLTFVGIIVSPLAALPLGGASYSAVVFWLALVAAVVIWALSILQFVKQDVPPPLRPLLAIHLAPASLLGTVALLMGDEIMGIGFGLFAVFIFAALAIRAQWLTAAGFSPLWGAFTFPIAAFASLMMVLGGAYGGVYRLLGGVALVAATLFIPWVAYKVIQMWAKGPLAAKTNAAEA